MSVLVKASFEAFDSEESGTAFKTAPTQTPTLIGCVFLMNPPARQPQKTPL
jgi:hypothetical protein